MDDLKKATLLLILSENIAKEATVYTDKAGQYNKLGDEFKFRYSNRISNGIDNQEHARLTLTGSAEKRLTYQEANV